jgi:hypothetical protein
MFIYIVEVLISLSWVLANIQDTACIEILVRCWHIYILQVVVVVSAYYYCMLQKAFQMDMHETCFIVNGSA